MATAVKMQGAFTTYGGWITSIIVAFLGWLYQSRKVKVEESDLILSRWKDFSDTHQADMLRLRSEAEADRTRLQADLSAVRRELGEVRTEFAAFRREAEDQIKSRDLEIAGLRRTISQISQSTAVQLGLAKERSDLNRSDIESLAGGQPPDLEIEENVERLNRIGDNSEGGDDGTKN